MRKRHCLLHLFKMDILLICRIRICLSIVYLPDIPSQPFSLGSFIEFIPSASDTIDILDSYAYEHKRKRITRKTRERKKAIESSKKGAMTDEIVILEKNQVDLVAMFFSRSGYSLGH